MIYRSSVFTSYIPIYYIPHDSQIFYKLFIGIVAWDNKSGVRYKIISDISKIEAVYGSDAVQEIKDFRDKLQHYASLGTIAERPSWVSNIQYDFSQGVYDKTVDEVVEIVSKYLDA